MTVAELRKTLKRLEAILSHYELTEHHPDFRLLHGLSSDIFWGSYNEPNIK